MLVGDGLHIIDGIGPDSTVIDVQYPPVVGTACNGEAVRFPIVAFCVEDINAQHLGKTFSVME